MAVFGMLPGETASSDAALVKSDMADQPSTLMRRTGRGTCTPPSLPARDMVWLLSTSGLPITRTVGDVAPVAPRLAARSMASARSAAEAAADEATGLRRTICGRICSAEWLLDWAEPWR